MKLLIIVPNVSIKGEALVDGETLKWDYHDPFDGLDGDEINNISAQDIEKRKSDSMEMNAWSTGEQVRLRIDDERGPAGDFLKAYMTEPLGMCSLYLIPFFSYHVLSPIYRVNFFF